MIPRPSLSTLFPYTTLFRSDIFPGKESHHFGEHVLEKSEGGFFHVEEIRVDAPVSRHCLRRLIRRTQLRIGDDGRGRMPGHVDLRHDGDVARLRVRDDAAHVVLGVDARIPTWPTGGRSEVAR